MPLHPNFKEMATASDTASQILHSTTEKENYMRISRLLIVGGTNLIRGLFDLFFPPSSLPNKLTDPATKNKLRRTLIKPERDKVYPSTGGCGESKDFDITLLSKLMKTISPLAPPVTGWDDLPSLPDLSLAADIVRIKVYRNALCHQYYNMEINDDEFSTLWNDVKKALLRIAGFLSSDTKVKWEKEIDELLNDRLTPEAERNARELHEWYLKDMDVKECIEQGLKNLEIRSQRSEESISRVERQVEHVQERLERESHDAREETVQRIDVERNERLDNEFQQIRELISRRAASLSREQGGQLTTIPYTTV